MCLPRSLPPYDVLRSDVMPAQELARLQCFALGWDRLNNRNPFSHSRPLLWQVPAALPFAAIESVVADIYNNFGHVHAVGLADWGEVLALRLQSTMGC